MSRINYLREKQEIAGLDKAERLELEQLIDNQ